MVFWFAAFLLTACATALVAWPLIRPVRPSVASAAHDVSVYRDQLDEIARDVADGSLGASEAESARAEIGRRLLRAAAEEGREQAGGNSSGSSKPRLALLAVLAFIPAAGLAGYLFLGNPGAPSMPLSAREAGSSGDPELASLIEKAEEHLRANPDDGRGWDVLAPIYLRTGRIQDATIAYGNAIRLLGPTAKREAGLGEALVMQNRGAVTRPAADALHRALALDPKNPMAQFFLAVGLAQDGKSGQALSAFRSLRNQAPEDAAWLPMVDDQIAALTASAAGEEAPSPGMQSSDGDALPPGNPTDEQMAAAGKMSAGDRMAMIRGMVDRLDRQLADRPDNLPGWKRLVRSYMVLGDKSKAEAALTRALKAFPADSDEGRQLIALAGNLGMNTESRQ